MVLETGHHLLGNITMEDNMGKLPIQIRTYPL